MPPASIGSAAGWEDSLKTRFYIDAAPLQEREYTGIPHVAAKLCEQLLGDSEVEPGFFYGRHEMPTGIVEQLLAARTGSLIRWAAERYCHRPLLTPAGGDRVFGLHTNMKFTRRLFPIEGQIVHDLTTIVTPQYHTDVTNHYHQTKFFGDLMSNDVIFTVSKSTALDVTDYFPETRAIPLVVSHLGVDWAHIAQDVREATGPVEKYILVLGTIEPRKNVSIVLDLLQAKPEIAQRYRIVFGGRIGWGDAFEQQLAERGLGPLLASGRIVQTGFVSETAKYQLFKNAAVVIYPSVYEGFGLPVAEAVSLGTPIVTTSSSSIPEVGRDFAYYFLPGDRESLDRALADALATGHSDVSRSGETLADWLAYFSWDRCYRTIKDGFVQAATAKDAR